MGGMKPTDKEDNELQDRYDSLKSLYRLVENDLTEQICSNRRLSVPVQKSSLNLYTSGTKWRNTSVTDYIHALTLTRANVIQRLVPDMTSEGHKLGNPRHSSDRVSECKADLAKMYKLCEHLIHECREQKQNENERSNEDCFTKTYTRNESYMLERAVDDLRERVARFEALKNVSRSFHADDFQQFLGARYLDLYKSRKEGCCDELANVPKRRYSKTQTVISSSNNVNDERKRRSMSCLNMDMHTMARRMSQRCDTVPQIKPILPPLPQRKKLFKDHLETLNDFKHMDKDGQTTNHQEVVPIKNDIADEYLNVSTRPGIPHHTANRALSRNYQSYRLNSMFTDLRRYSAISPKTEEM